MTNRKYAAILGVYGNPSDRFMGCGYKKEQPSVKERIEMASKSKYVRSLEFTTGPGEDVFYDSANEIVQLVKDSGLEICAMNPNLWGYQKWEKGTLGSADPDIRRQAIDYCKQVMDLAAEYGVRNMGIWPGQDGYDYVFEVDYQKQYEWWITGVQELADHNPNIQICLEYKPYEPRTHSTIDTAPKTLLMLRDIDRANVGMTLDIGHALVQHENLGDVISLAQQRQKLFHMHLNDNYGDWDWDMNFASVRTFEMIEMLYWLKRTKFDGWYSIDIFAYRTPQSDSVDESLAWLDTLMNFVDETGQEKFDELISAGDPIANSRFFRQSIFGHYSK